MRGGKAAAAEGDRRRGARAWAAARRCKNVIVYQRTGGNVAHGTRARDTWLHELVAGPGRHAASPNGSSAEHPLFILYTSGSTGKPKGVQHSHRRLPAAGGADDEVDLRHQARRRLLVHRRHRLGHRPHLHRLRPARASARTEVVFEGVPTYPDAGRFWKMIAGPQGHDLLHRADRDPLADQGGRGATPQVHPNELRPVEPAHPRHGRRADQSGSVDVVPRARRRRALPDRRHLVADRDRRPHDHAAAGRDAAGAGLVHAAAARASWPRSSTRPATTCRTARAASSSSSGRGRR